MSKIKFTYILNGCVFKKSVKSKAEAAKTAFHLSQHGATDIKCAAYEKKDGKYGYYAFAASTTCRRCGRELTDPESIKRGIGPECIKKGDLHKGNGGKPSDAAAADLQTRSIPVTLQETIFNLTNPNRRTCRFCNTPLQARNLYYYPHAGGYLIPSLQIPKALEEGKAWVFIECFTCGHEWSLNHLGVYQIPLICNFPKK